MGKPVRVVHYLNQFFGGIGGEERAQTPLEAREGPVGPGRALQEALGAEGTVVATLVCGDDYVAEREEAAGASMRDALQRYQPDLVIAGPAFDSGRYGLGCALACRVARSLGVPAVTGMYPENAAIITHRRELLAVPTGLNTTDMRNIIGRMTALGLKVVRGEPLGSALEEGYIPHGIRKLVRGSRAAHSSPRSWSSTTSASRRRRRWPISHARRSESSSAPASFRAGIPTICPALARSARAATRSTGCRDST